MRRRSIVFALALGLASLGAPAAPCAAPDMDAAFRADVARLMEITGSAKIGQQMASLVSQQVLDGFKRAHPDVPPRAFDIGQEVLQAEFEKAFGGPDSLLDRMIPIYGKYFTHEDVRQLIAFYQTDLGKKTIAVLPTLMQDGMAVGQQWAAEIMPRVQRAMEERLKAEGYLK